MRSSPHLASPSKVSAVNSPVASRTVACETKGNTVHSSTGERGHQGTSHIEPGLTAAFGTRQHNALYPQWGAKLANGLAWEASAFHYRSPIADRLQTTPLSPLPVCHRNDRLGIGRARANGWNGARFSPAACDPIAVVQVASSDSQKRTFRQVTNFDVSGVGRRVAAFGHAGHHSRCSSTLIIALDRLV